MKRYEPLHESDKSGSSWCEMWEDHEGEWVKWADVPQWISVADSLPEPMRMVLGWHAPNGTCPEITCVNSEGRWNLHPGPTHWMIMTPGPEVA